MNPKKEGLCRVSHRKQKKGGAIMRTVSYLSTLNGRVYVYLANAQVGEQFMQQAEDEGFTFNDGTLPTARCYDEVMAVNHDKTLNYVGANGHIAFGAGANTVGSEELIRVDYEKYLSGQKDYSFTGRHIN